nr:MAG TPA: hypothetical protein [Caudoviricetes sp.]
MNAPLVKYEFWPGASCTKCFSVPEPLLGLMDLIGFRLCKIQSRSNFCRSAGSASNS